MNHSLEDLIKDERRDISSKLIRIGCGNPAPDTWKRWRKECGVAKNTQLIRRWDAILLICRSQWQNIRKDMGVEATSPDLDLLIDYGIPWFQANCRNLGDVFNMVLEPSQTAIDPFWGIEGRDLPAAIRAITGKIWSLSTIRRRCQKLGWTLRSNEKYSYARVIKLSKTLSSKAS